MIFAITFSHNDYNHLWHIENVTNRNRETFAYYADDVYSVNIPEQRIPGGIFSDAGSSKHICIRVRSVTNFYFQFPLFVCSYNVSDTCLPERELPYVDSKLSSKSVTSQHTVNVNDLCTKALPRLMPIQNIYVSM